MSASREPRRDGPEDSADYVVVEHERGPEGHLVRAWPVGGGPARWYLDLSGPDEIEIGQVGGERGWMVVARLVVEPADDAAEGVAGQAMLDGTFQRRIVPARAKRTRDVLQVTAEGARAELSRADLGLQDQPVDVLDQFQRAPVGLVQDGTRWAALLLEPDAAGWLAGQAEENHRAAQAARQGAEQAARRRDLERETADTDITFVNPYTFVPLPPGVRRERPEGHERLRSGNLSGKVTVDWTLLSPLLMPQDAPPLTAEPLVVRGSAIKGMVRSLHETLFDGCLRVFDTDYVPVHRHTSVNHAEWRLALIRGTDDRIQAEICPDVKWVAASLLQTAGAGGQPPSSGDLIRIVREELAPGRRDRDRPGGGRQGPRRAVLDAGEVRHVDASEGAADAWVVHLTDTGARVEGKPLRFPVGRLPGELVEVSEAALADYRDLCETSADWSGVGPRTADPSSRERRVPVRWPANSEDGKDVIGYRVVTDGRLLDGDTVWVRRDPQTRKIAEVQPSLLWRYRGAVPAGRRIDGTGDPAATLAPCTDPDQLCPSCAIFGSTDDRGDRDGGPGGDRTATRGVRAYAGHVRFGPAVSSVPVSSRLVQLPPMGSPRPSSGNFYLQHPRSAPDRPREKGSPSGTGSLPGPHQVPVINWPDGVKHGPPLADWGSALDRPEPRRIAGRKYYWHGYAADHEHPRHERRPHDDDQDRPDGMCRDGHVVDNRVGDAPVVLTGEVRFSNLTETQLAQLLAALEPGLVLGEVDSGQSTPDGRPVLTGRSFCMHLGGGKALGYGTAHPRIRPGSLCLESAQSRYADAAPPSHDAASLARRVVPDEVNETWRALASALTRDRVDPRRIWYPPALPWSRRLSRGKPDPDFDASYEFFGFARGGSLTEERQPMVALRPAVDASQAMPILSQAAEAAPPAGPRTSKRGRR